MLPSLGQGFQPPQRPQPPAVQPGSDQGHLLVKGIQQPLKLGLGESPPQQLRALTQQAAVATEQLGIDRLELQHHPIQPLPAQGRLTAHELQVQGAETDAAQGTNQLVLTLQHLAVPAGLPPPLPAQFQFQAIAAVTVGGDQPLPLPLLNQIPVAAAAVGAKTAEQLDCLQQVGFALTIAANHQQSRGLEGEAQRSVITELTQLQAVQPNGSLGPSDQ